MANRDECFKNIKEAAKDFLEGFSKADADHFVNKILDIAQKILDTAEERAAKGESKKQVITRLFGEYLKEQRISNERYLIEMKMDKVKLDKIMNQIDSLNFDPDKAQEVLSSLLTGNVKNRAGSQNSVWQMAHVKKVKYLTIIEDLKHKGLFDVLASGEKDLAIAKEVYELSTPGGKPGITRDSGALEIAQTVHRYNQEKLLDMQDAGILVRNRAGYISKEVHDKIRISVAGFERWARDVSDLDPLIMGKKLSDADRMKVLKEAYDNITIGQKERALEAGEGPFSVLAGKKQATAHGMSAERIIHFKDADSWYKYNQKYGSNTIFESIYRGITEDTRKMAFVEKLGTDPEASFKALKTKLNVKYRQDVVAALRDLDRNTNPDLKAGLEKKVEIAEKREASFKGKIAGRMLEAQFNEASGITSMGSDNLWNNTASAILAWNNVRLLGKATLSLVVDPVNGGWNLATSLGDSSVTHGMIKMVSEYASLFKPAERKMFLEALEISNENNIMASHNDISGDPVKPGMMVKGLEWFFKSTGLSQVSEGTRFGVTKTMADILTKNRHLEFDALNHQTGNSFNNFEITKDVWDIIRQGVITLETENGPHEMIAPSGIRTAPAPQGVDPRVWRRQTEAAATKYAMFLNNYADMSTHTSTGSSRAILLQGTTPGTPINAALKLMAQFKTPSVQVFNMLRQGLHNNASVPYDSSFKAMGDMNNVRALSQFMAWSMTAGYVGLTARAFLNGESPPDPTKPKVALEAAAKSGMAGYYGDFIFGEFDRTFRNAISTAVGPTAQPVNDIFKIWSKALAGDKIGKDSFNLLLKSMPGNNHIVLRPLLDVGILNHFQEDENPGYFNRRNRRLQKDSGSHLLGR